MAIEFFFSTFCCKFDKIYSFHNLWEYIYKKRQPTVITATTTIITIASKVQRSSIFLNLNLLKTGELKPTHTGTSAYKGVVRYHLWESVGALMLLHRWEHILPVLMLSPAVSYKNNNNTTKQRAYIRSQLTHSYHSRCIRLKPFSKQVFEILENIACPISPPNLL